MPKLCLNKNACFFFFCLNCDCSAILILGRWCTLKVPTEHHPVRVHNLGQQDLLRLTAAGDKARAGDRHCSVTDWRICKIGTASSYNVVYDCPAQSGGRLAVWIQLPMCHESPRHWQSSMLLIVCMGSACSIALNAGLPLTTMARPVSVRVMAVNPQSNESIS